MTEPPANETCLVAALRQGDDQALNQLIARWERPLCAFAYRYLQNEADARELVAETFVRLHQQRQKLRPDTRPSAWLFTTLANLCHNQNRWRRRHPTVSLDSQEDDTHAPLSESTASEAPQPSECLVASESVQAVRQAIDRLPHELKTTLLLYHYEHLSYREIGAITDCSERGVETRLYRAKQRLRADLAGFLNEPALAAGSDGERA